MCLSCGAPCGKSMKCPFCSHGESRVVDSRDSGDEVRRRRECLSCERRFTTYERVRARTIQVVKSDERREDFDSSKLWNSLSKACAKRPLPVEAIQKIVDDIEADVGASGRTEIPSRSIGEAVMERLRTLDRVAYIRYASVYRDFKDIETFREEIDALMEPKSGPQLSSNQLTFLDDQPLLPQKGRRRRSRTPQADTS